MKKAILILLVFCSSISYAQEKKIEIDYVVDYVIPNKKTQSIDTISIGFNKDGKFLWSNSNLFENEFSSLIKNPSLVKESNSNLLYDVESNSIIMILNIDDSQIFMNMNINLFFPAQEVNSFNEELNFKTKKLNGKSKVLGTDYDAYELFTENNPESSLQIVTEDKYIVNNNYIFSKFIELMLNLTSSSGSISMDLPKGLIMKISTKNETILEAIKVNTDKKILILNYNFQIKE